MDELLSSSPCLFRLDSDRDVRRRPEMAEKAFFHTKEEALLAEEMNERFLVQPDFEIMVPPGVSFADRWELEAASQHLSSDGVSLYRITKESFLFACENGRTAEGVLHFLESRSMYGLSGNIVSTLRGWGEQYGRTQLQEAVLLRCRDRETAEAVERMESAAPLLLGRLGEKDFIVNAAQKEELEELLYRSGLSPKKNGQKLSRILRDVSFSCGRHGWNI